MKTLFILLILGLASAAAFIYSGSYDIGADAPHWPVTFKLMETLRERSVAVRAGGIVAPDLDDAALIAEGAEHYSAMCTGCHLAPGMDETEMRAGLYPQPPNLATHGHGHGEPAKDAARQFWVIKHGLKMTAMPAWGTSHDDEAIWGLVAFVRKLPQLSETEYEALTASAGDHEHGVQHDAGAAPAQPAHAHGEAMPAPAIQPEAADTHEGHQHAH